MLKTIMAATALSALACAGALAQPNAPSTPSDTKTTTSAPPAGHASFVTRQTPDQFLASKFKGTDVIGTQDEKIGDVSDILFDKDGKIDAYVVSVGGFLGMGAKEVAMAPSSFDIVPGESGSAPKLKISMSKDDLKNAQNFARYEPPRPSTTGMGGGLSGSRPAGGSMGGGAPSGGTPR